MPRLRSLTLVLLLEDLCCVFVFIRLRIASEALGYHLFCVESAKGLGLIEKQQLFSVYSHPTRGYRFSEDSIFAGTEVPNRIDTVGAWASFSLVAAEIKLLKYALVEETNQ